MKESTLSQNIGKAIRARPHGWARKVAGGPQQAGWPDIVGSYRGHFLGFEVKLPGKEHTLTTLQGQTLQLIRDAGGIGRVVTSVKQVNEILDRIDSKYVDRKG